jgi:hypothetical protein
MKMNEIIEFIDLLEDYVKKHGYKKEMFDQVREGLKEAVTMPIKTTISNCN